MSKKENKVITTKEKELKNISKSGIENIENSTEDGKIVTARSLKGESKRKLYGNRVFDFEALKNFLFSMTLEKSGYVEYNKRDLSKQIRTPIRFGLLISFISLFLFGVWSIFAPLDSATIAEGHVILSDYRKQIFHLEGGIVEKILVKDGDYVEKGQKLIILNDARTKSDLEKVLWQLRYSIIIDERLLKSLKLISYYQKNYALNKEFYTDVNFDRKYIDTNDDKIVELINAQKYAFNSYKLFIDSSIKTYKSSINQKKAEIRSVQERIKTHRQNVLTLDKEYKKRKNLYDQKLETSERLSQVKLELQKSRGQVLEDEAKLAGQTHEVSGIISRMANFLDEQTVRLSEDYKRNHTELLTLQAYYIQAKDAHDRTIVSAPNSGIVNALSVHTVKSAIRHDKPLLEIIPQDDNLIIEASVSLNEIDSIILGNKVRVQLNAYKTRLVPRIEGKIIYISADKFDKETHGMMVPNTSRLASSGFYKVKIEITPEELAKINMDIKLYPGMPVTVFIVKGTRTFAQYLYSPIIDSFHKAFKEV